MVAVGTLYFVEQMQYKADKALIAALYNGVKLEKKAVDPEKDPKNPDFVAKNPTLKVPFLQTECGVIFTSNAVARYVARCRADTALYGRCFDDEGQIDEWLEFCLHELEGPLMTWVYPVLGLMEDNAQVTGTAKSDVGAALGMLEAQLKGSEYLIGDFVTLADIANVCALRLGFAHVFDPNFRKPYPKVCAWFEKCCKLTQFAAVLGDIKLCGAAAAPKAVAAAAGAPAKAKGKAKAEPKAGDDGAAELWGKLQAEQKEKKAAAPAAAGGDAEAAVIAKGDEIRACKDKLKADGLSGKKINTHEEIVRLVDELNKLKEAMAAAPAAAPVAAAAQAPAAASGGDADAQIKAKGDEIRVLKEKLKADGLSGKKVNNHEEVLRLVAELAALKEGAPAAPKQEEKPKPQEAKPQKEGKKDAKASEEQAPTAEELEKQRKDQLKKSIKEGGKRGVEIEGAADMGGLQFFCTSVDEPKGDLDMLLESMKAMNADSDPTQEERKGGSGHVGKMIFSAGVEQLAVVAYVPAAKQSELNCEEWLQAVLGNFAGKVSSKTKDVCSGVVMTDSNKNVFPLKIREPMILEANNFLRKRGLFPEDDSDDDEMVFGDDDFPSM